MADDLLALAERCEKAEGPDRELDTEIARYFRVTVWKRNDDDTANYETTHWRYTESVDSAASLVPEGWRWMAGHREHPHARAYVENGAPAFVGISSRRNPDRQWYEVTAANPALALAAASLRAQARPR